MGGGMGRAAPCAMRLPGFSAAFPAEGPGGIPEPAQARWKPVAGGVQGPGLPGSARVDPRSRGAAAAGDAEGKEPLAAAPSASGVGCYAKDSASEPSLLMWCLSRALPALTTIMSMPSKRTGTSPSGV